MASALDSTGAAGIGLPSIGHRDRHDERPFGRCCCPPQGDRRSLRGENSSRHRDACTRAQQTVRDLEPLDRGLFDGDFLKRLIVRKLVHVDTLTKRPQDPAKLVAAAFEAEPHI